MKTFNEFWPFYLSQHTNPTNRKIHFVGTFLVHVLVVLAFLSDKNTLFFLLPIVGYGFAWIGHFVFEKNRPATFKYPFWSLMGDFKMFYLMCIGKLWR